MEVSSVKIGKYTLGKNEPIRVQSMTNTKTEDAKSTIEQIKRLKDVGCEIVRISIPTIKAAENIPVFKNQFPDLPLVADIHFDYRLALKSIEYGIDKLRLNPGNIQNKEQIKEIVLKAKKRNIPIRIGINGGSLPKDLIEKYHKITPAAMVEAAEREIKYLEELDFREIIISLKSSDVRTTIEANKIFRERFSYPLHLGITESGTINSGSINSAVGIGTLVYMGIGETIRISLSGDPVKEVTVGYRILKALRKRSYGITIHSCPTCSRANIPVADIAEELEELLKGNKKDITICVMGCVVNGPGEALQSDIGIVGTELGYIIYEKDRVIKKFKTKESVKNIIAYVEAIVNEKYK